MLRVIICDDDMVVLKKLNSLVVGIFKLLEEKVLIHAYANAENISDKLLSSCDIALLDIDFSSTIYNGMDLARKLRRIRKDAIIIFITNYIEYAPEGYEVQAFRYILKRDLDKVLQSIFIKAIAQVHDSRETIKIRVDGEFIDLRLDDILFWEVQQHYITVHVIKDSTGRIKNIVFMHPCQSMKNSWKHEDF